MWHTMGMALGLACAFVLLMAFAFAFVVYDLARFAVLSAVRTIEWWVDRRPPRVA